MAEWLRRWTRNPLGSPRAGSNPADYVEEVDFSFSIITNMYNFLITHLLAHENALVIDSPVFDSL